MIKDSLINLDGINSKFIDTDKLSRYAREIPSGINNYFIFQNFFNFHWPYWLYSSYSAKSKTFSPVIPYLLLNNNNRNWISFSNRSSSREVHIDPAGMISSPIDHWSVEFWILEKEILYRPQERISSVTQYKDLDTFLINQKWKELNFEFSESIYCIKQEQQEEELAVELTATLQKSNTPIYIFIVIRPYDILNLGSVDSIEYNNKSRVIAVNQYDSVYLETKPDYILAGNAAIGDIDFSLMDTKVSSTKCNSGMATMAFGYNLNKGKNENKLRINFSNKKSYKPVKINYQKLKEEYIEIKRLNIKEGFRLTFSDKQFQNWIYGTKNSALNCNVESSSGAIDKYTLNLKSIFYVACGYHRMGFFPESLKLLNIAANLIGDKDRLEHSNILDRCYYINTVSDYFKISRDIEYVKLKYKFIREIITPAIEYCAGIKGKKRKIYRNSIEDYYVLEYHVYDIIVISNALFEFSYLARCVGIFSDELKFSKESLRLEELILNDINKLIGEKDPDSDAGDAEEEADNDDKAAFETAYYKNEYYAYSVFAGYPFSVKSLASEKLKRITDKISASFNENPIYFKSAGGCDILFSIIYAINLLLVKDERVHNITNKLFELGSERYVLQDFINPKTMSGIRGKGDSPKAISAFFILLRSLMFIDTQEKLEIFPVPKAEWFIEGSEIKIEEAPSVFGKISFKVITTKNEVQFYFYDSPKYIPPNMMINLPFSTRIIQEDDFIIKKETGNSFMLHGWPSLIRFVKK